MIAPRRRSAVGPAVALVCASLVACAPRPAYYPPEPAPAPAPRALTVTPQRRQSQRQQDRDKSECQNLASAQATSSTSWAQIFASCMGGRGYMVE